jgi:hypothetical protein
MNNIKKLIVTVLLIALTLSPAAAIPAHAQWIDISTMAKEYGLDALAFQLVNMIIKRISASTINWINSGFKGSPAYVTNPEAYFGNMGDKIAGQYIFSNPNLNFLCGPIKAKIRLALTKNYIQDTDQWQCTLTQVGKNMDNFMSSFENGGWDSFFEISQKTTMNPIGAYLKAENELYLEISTRQGTAKTELLQGNGFLSYKQCKPGTESVSGGTQQCFDSYQTCLDAEGPSKKNSRIPLCNDALTTCQKNLGGVQEGECKDSDKETVTPGSVIGNKLNSVLGQSEGRLVVADEINEMISALISQLTEKLVGGAIGGLKGLSESSPTNNNQSFANQMLNDKSNQDYFGNAPDTSVLDNPVRGQAPDADCKSVDSATLDQMAQKIVNNTGIPFDQARNNIDCDPPGIHPYTTEDLMQSADSLTYDTGVTSAQMNAIHDSWVAKITTGMVTNISSGSVLAYMLSWGGLPEGTTRTVGNTTYTLSKGIWVMQ